MLITSNEKNEDFLLSFQSLNSSKGKYVKSSVPKVITLCSQKYQNLILIYILILYG